MVQTEKAFKEWTRGRNLTTAMQPEYAMAFLAWRAALAWQAEQEKGKSCENCFFFGRDKQHSYCHRKNTPTKVSSENEYKNFSCKYWEAREK